MNLLNSSLSEIVALIKNKKCSVAEVCQFYLDRIKRLNPKLNAVLTLNPVAQDIARKMDENVDHYKDKPLMGIPILIKDVFCTKDLKTTVGSKILENFIPPYSAEVVERLEKAGAIIIGKCNQDEFAMGNTNENSAFGKTLNPWDKNCVPGGSSGGSAAAVCAGLCAASIGTDTGGSIRQPASFCNIVGIKPTYGRVSRYGMIAYASSLDQAGPMTMSVEDAALLLQVISGKDEKDSTSSQSAVPDWYRELNPSVKSLKVAVLNSREIEDTCHPCVKKTLHTVIELLKKEGAVIDEIDIPLMDKVVSIYYLISTSEASSNLARYDGVRYGFRSQFKTADSLNHFYSKTRGAGFGSEVKRRILMGTYCLSYGYYDQYYNKACQIRRQLRDEMVKYLSEYSLILSPVSATPAFRQGEKQAGSIESYWSDSFTVLSNLAGIPSLSVPAGFSDKNLPIGVQFMAKHFDEQTLFNVALLIQNKLKAIGRRPNDA